MTITWRQTGLGIFYPTNNGVDISRELIKKHGCTLRQADHPYLNSQEEATEWASVRGYSSKFDLTSTPATPTVKASLDMGDI